MEILRAIAVAAFAVWCVVLSFVDIRERRLPNRLTLGGAGTILAVAVSTGEARPAVVGALLLMVSYLAVHLLAPASLGAGDVKLALGVGAVAGMCGASAWLLAALLAPLAAASAALVLLALRRPAVVPHGPFMCGATMAALVGTLV